MHCNTIVTITCIKVLFVSPVLNNLVFVTFTDGTLIGIQRKKRG